MKTYCIIIFFAFLFSNKAEAQFNIGGEVKDAPFTQWLVGARITLFNIDTTYFREARVSSTGTYSFQNVPPGNYTIGASYPGKEYATISANVTSNFFYYNFNLVVETQPGIWQTIVQSPEALGGTNLGILLPNGKIFYCHSTKDPFYFNPVTGDTIPFNGDSVVQGCTGPVLMPNGLVFMAGGTLQEVYGPGTRKVKTFNYITNSWVVRDSLLDYRWYPTITKLADNRLLICGGGNLNNPQRTNTSEIYDPTNWTTQFTDTIAIGNEVSPVVMLYNGKVLMTHRPPQLFNPSTMQWDSAGQFVQYPRMPNGDHADHELVLLSNGDAIAVGYKSFTANLGTFIERYNPVSDSWTLGSSINPIRSRAKAVLLPDEKILVMAGYKEDALDTTSTNQWGYMNLCDLYDPSTDSWRRLSRMNLQREYHCNTILVPDGRVIAVGGEGQPGNEPPFSYIEAFSPPYLFRGIRPAISNLSTTNFQRSATIYFNVSLTDSLTDVVLYSTQCVTHFMNTGNNRFVHLSFSQSGSAVTATLPVDSLILPDGFYMLFAKVDDIPSVAKMVSLSGHALTSVNEIAMENNLMIYPNPANNQLNISYRNSFSVVLNSMDGREITAGQSNGNHLILNVANIPNGIYFLSIADNKNSFAKKIIVMHH